VVFLTLTALLVLSPFRKLHAAVGYTDVSSPVLADRPMESPFDDQDRNQQIGSMLAYLKKESPGWVPGLPMNELLNSRTWMREKVRSNLSEMSGGEEDGIATMMRSPTADTSEATWLLPDYHHNKTILPFKDALEMGFSARRSLWNKQVQFDVHPFYGQNWLSANGYIGTEVSLNLRSEEAPQPWGKISMGYINGDSNLMNNGRGYDMHTELNFTNHVSLNAGVRNDDVNDVGNYVMLRWKIFGD
jgi:hypothetical protein